MRFEYYFRGEDWILVVPLQPEYVWIHYSDGVVIELPTDGLPYEYVVKRHLTYVEEVVLHED